MKDKKTWLFLARLWICISQETAANLGITVVVVLQYLNYSENGIYIEINVSPEKPVPI
jgi:hypothetical protein